MTLIRNEHWEFIDDFDPYSKPLKLKECHPDSIRMQDPPKKNKFGTRVCEECLCEYEAWAKDQKFCSTECREENHRKRRRK